jgi:excisionase family DNA binding protein
MILFIGIIAEQMNMTGAALLSVDQVAERLGVHVKTVRRYVRDGRLKGVRIGKQYRILAEDLAALTGQQARVPESVRRERYTEVSSIVQIDAISPADAMRVMNGVGGAIKGRDKGTDTPLRVDTVYDETRGRLKVIVTGSLATTTTLLRLVAAYVE